MKDKLHGTVIFIFQPGEEVGCGALSMVKARLCGRCGPET
jgi:metal-dependent amidase/aminoacylase/carboxypeptidase family protein